MEPMIQRIDAETVHQLEHAAHVQQRDRFERLLEQTGISPDTAVMVGDRRYDVEGGKKHGLYTVGVLFGYGSREELTQAGADRLIGTPEELLDM